MTANKGLKEDRHCGSVPIILELEPSETFVYRSTAMLEVFELRLPYEPAVHDGTVAFGGEFRADPAVLARETQTVSRSEGDGREAPYMSAGRLDDIGAGLSQAENCRNHLCPPWGPQPQSIELVIGRSKPGRRVGARAWPATLPKALDQAPVIPSG